MSVLESVAPKIKEAIQELQEIQWARRKARMAVELGHGHAKFIDDAGNIVAEVRGQIILQNVNGTLELWIGSAFAPGRFPCNKIKWYNCINTVTTFELEGFPPVTKVILTVDSIDQINNIIAHVKPPPVQRPLTYQHDGNITSSESESEDSARGRTTSSVNNSFESDEPSTSENL